MNFLTPALEQEMKKANGKCIETSMRFLILHTTKKDKARGRRGDMGEKASFISTLARDAHYSIDCLFISEEGTCFRLTKEEVNP